LTTEKANKTLFIIVAADDDAVEGIALTPEIQRRAPHAKIIRFDPRSTVEEYQKVVREAEQFDSIFLAPFVKRAALKGTVALPENQTNFIKQMIASNKPVGIVAFGSPYLIRQFPEAKNYVVTYAIEEVAQTAAVRTIFGEISFVGKIPVSVPGIFEIGAGIIK
jgi:beta-N-acetylhexosaminidase